ncbi:MAG TPA: antitoxin MazE-like protein [Candidatus Binataceae bacterium]|jgi:hypothetical protein|nr:antitoxin MazE-like protein [Candidatus Binataceae bacterium]
MRRRRDKVTHRRQPLQQELVAIEMPDVTSPAFKAEAHRQSLAIAHSPYEKMDQEFIDAISDWNGE